MVLCHFVLLVSNSALCNTLFFFYPFLWYEHKGISNLVYLMYFFKKYCLFTELFCSYLVLPFCPHVLFHFLNVSCPVFSSCIYHVRQVRLLSLTNVSLWIRKTILINIFRHYQYFLSWEHAWPPGSIYCWYLFSLTFILFCRYFVTQH